MTADNPLMKRIAFLVSGNGGTLAAVLGATRRLGWPISVPAVFADRPCGALNIAERHGIRNEIVPYRATDDTALARKIEELNADLIITNIHKILSPGILALHPNRFLNLHYSLLPAFAGLIGMETLVQAERAGTKWVGATAHLVDDNLDGGPILGQSILGVDWDRDQFSDVQDCLFRSACLVMLSALQAHLNLPKADPIESITISGRATHFNPPLCFSAERLDEEYWRSLR